MDTLTELRSMEKILDREEVMENLQQLQGVHEAAYYRTPGCVPEVYKITAVNSERKLPYSVTRGWK
jgi:hypothetical protein